jgi:hypothetical protein
LGYPFASNLETFPWLNLQISMGVDRGEREEKEGRSFTVWQGRASEMIEEREGRRGKRGFLLLWPHGLTPGVTGQTGDGHRSDR